MKNMIKLRPHHLLCTQGFNGKGYSADFVENMTAITSRLRSDFDVMVEIVFSTDDICSRCPHMLGENLCQSNEKVNRFDAKVIAYFGIEEKGYIYKEIVHEIHTKMTQTIMDDICGECNWYAVSDCQKKILGET